MWLCVGAPSVVKCIHGQNGKFILVIKANEMHYFSSLFGKEIYIFRTDLLSIIRSLKNVFTATGICRVEILKIGKTTSVYVYMYIVVKF